MNELIRGGESRLIHPSPEVSRVNVSITVKNVSLRNIWKTETLLHFFLHKSGSALESPVGILLEDSRMVLARVFTALNYEGHQWVKLRIGVSREMCMGRRLDGELAKQHQN